MIESLCKTCEKRPTCDMYEPIATVAGCSYFVSQKKAVKTNADHIRAMTDEELAKGFVNLQDDVCKAFGEQFPDNKEWAIIKWLDWLRQEANDE